MRLSKEQIELLKKLFTEDALTPGQAADKAGVTYATANRYYGKWAPEIKKSLERQLIPRIQESLKLTKKKKPLPKKQRARSWGLSHSYH